MLRGVRVAGDVYAVFEHIEPKGDGLPNWLDLDVPDDRFAASTLLLQSRHPGSAVYVATRDIKGPRGIGGYAAGVGERWGRRS
ncbi:hypothetical protein ACN6K9_002453 [Streptomyces sp. SAS_267]|uniref:hypothetical protein n=1 Tax=Streptomyces sp. SAS_267 TaxID=3412750 RepID=UPI00403D0205